MLTSTLKRYPAYKPSGQWWLGDVPKSWSVSRLSFYANQFGSGTTPKSTESKYYEDGDTNWLVTGDLTDGYIDKIPKKITTLATEQYTTLQLFPPGSVVIAMYGATIGKLGILRTESTCNQACCVINGSERLDNKYLFYYLQGSRNAIIDLARGGGQPNISQDTIRSLQATIPPLPEQIAIARYLDAKTNQIDTLIAAKERLVELLEEQRTALIHRAVTRGLDPDVKLKDSGVEWLGEVPEGWNVVKLKYLINMSGGGTPSKDRPDYWKGAIPWVSPKDMKSPTIIKTQDYITEVAVKESATSLIDSGAVLIVVRSGILKHTIPVAINNVPVTLNQDLKAITSGCEIFQNYFFHFVSGNQSQLLVEWGKQGATVESLESEQIQESQMPIPPKDEQIKILSFLNNEENKFSRKMNNLNNQIKSLRALRTSLISEVVTGKRDVRGHVLAQAGASLEPVN